MQDCKIEEVGIESDSALSHSPIADAASPPSKVDFGAIVPDSGNVRVVFSCVSADGCFTGMVWDMLEFCRYVLDLEGDID